MFTRAALLSAVASLVSAAQLPIGDRIVLSLRGSSPPSGTASGTLWLFPKAENYKTEDLASAADGFSSVACLALSNTDCTAVTSQAAKTQWESCEKSFGAKSQRWLLVNNYCAKTWSNIDAGVAALKGLVNSADGDVIGLAYNPEGGDKHMIQTAIESIPNMKLAYAMGPKPSAGCPAAPECSPNSRWTLLGEMYTLGADDLCQCFQESTAGDKAECLAFWSNQKYGRFAANNVGMFCVKTLNTDMGECNETPQCGAIKGPGPHIKHIEEYFAPDALESVMPVLKGTSTSHDVALYLPQY